MTPTRERIEWTTPDDCPYCGAEPGQPCTAGAVLVPAQGQEAACV
jgi:hypothetical protein